ncbi:MAG: response regulator [Niameybacter sp.]|uniref:response regulator transcription factor n=1 Tax=Niameybacter sp. TaxID=2033640 RepID=UPI002FCBC551
MYKVLIVDDEKIIRIGMRTIIDWESYGFKISEIASDGEQALQVIQEQSIDLVITDIKMPKMDGITLVKALKEQDFKGQIIMLTSYGEFDMARECLRYGVHDYLLKGTLRSTELIKTLDGVRPKLKQLERENEKEEVAENKEDLVCIEQVARKVLGNSENKIDGKAFIRGYQFLLIKYIKSKFDQEKNQDKTLINYQIAIQNIITEVMPKQDKSLVIIEGDWCLYRLPIPHETHYQEVHKISLQIQNLIKLYTNIKVIGVIGRTVYTNNDLQDSIKKCMRVTEMAFYTGYQDILKEEKINLIKSYRLKEDDTYERRLYKAMRDGEYAQAVHGLEAYIEHLRKYFVPQREVEISLDRILQQVILDYGIYLEKDRQHLAEIIEQYRKSTTLEELQVLINELIYTICTSMEQVKDKHYRKEIVEIMEYVEAHIGEKITLTFIANQVNMNESYISRLFKNETGMNIINYINIRKMEKAKELLKEKNMIVKDVAYALGFEEQSYFNRMFNKYFGVNPKEYKKCVNENINRSL